VLWIHFASSRGLVTPSLARAQVSTVSVRNFTVLASNVESYELHVTRTFNMDETALSTVQEPQKNLAIREKRQV